jgi:hypothetical protein
VCAQFRSGSNSNLIEGKPSQSSREFEPFVDADRVAEFLSMPRREVLKLTREGTITAYPVSGRIRKTFKYRLSEVGEDIVLLRKPNQVESCPAVLPVLQPNKHRRFHGEEI